MCLGLCFPVGLAGRREGGWEGCPVPFTALTPLCGMGRGMGQQGTVRLNAHIEKKKQPRE